MDSPPPPNCGPEHDSPCTCFFLWAVGRFSQGEACGSTGIAPVRVLTLSPSPQAVLKNLAEALGGYYHCYSPETEVSPSANALPLSSLPACLQARAWGTWARTDHAMSLLPLTAAMFNGLAQV